MPHLSANRDGIYVTSIKHAHAITACGSHRLEEFRHWSKARQGRQQQLQEQSLTPCTKTTASHAAPQKLNSFTEEKKKKKRCKCKVSLTIPLFQKRLFLLVNPPTHFNSVTEPIQLSSPSLSPFWLLG